MTPEQWQRVRPILESALDLDPASRATYLEAACADSFVRQEVESLIASHDQAGTDVLNPVSSPIVSRDAETRFRLPPGKRIGVYEVLDEIAVGGMGAVYRAVRADGQYKQQVALKIVRSELGTEFTTSRFKNERQILASLDHPNIAKILDGGTTAEGVAYFVMEFVEGQRLDEYCDAHKLATTERLKLFLQICSAVQYAHQHLIIHRDIKPGNILVNAEGVPKLLDFGIAKILESSGIADQPEQTISLVRLLTPEYASPEQIKGDPITTASDVYSLGVVLYELLTGCTPYDVPTYTSHEISRAVCEAEPEKPSTAVRRKQIATDDRGGKPPDDSARSEVREGSREKLSKRLRGDLDNIVLMALRKEPQRRYTSVEQIAQDTRRHLEHLPVIARKDTFGYRTSKFITRHKVGVAVAAVVTVALLTATGVTLRQARIARAERARAERRFSDVRKLANSLLFDVHDSIQTLQGATSARKLIVQLGLEYLDSLSAESAGDPGLERELATGYQKLGDVQASRTLGNVGDSAGGIASYRKAVKLREALSSRFPSDWTVQNDLARNYQVLGRALLVVGKQVESDVYLEKAFQISPVPRKSE
jgi:serine/threonine protein kinase